MKQKVGLRWTMWIYNYFCFKIIRQLLGTNTLHFRKLTKGNSQNEHKSPISFIGQQQFIFNRLSSHAPSIYSTHHTDHDHLIPPASTRHEKSKHSR